MSKRAEFTKKTKMAAFEREKGHCQRCGCKIITHAEYDHALEDYISKDNSLVPLLTRGFRIFDGFKVVFHAVLQNVLDSLLRACISEPAIEHRRHRVSRVLFAATDIGQAQPSQLCSGGRECCLVDAHCGVFLRIVVTVSPACHALSRRSRRLARKHGPQTEA